MFAGTQLLPFLTSAGKRLDLDGLDEGNLDGGMIGTNSSIARGIGLLDVTAGEVDRVCALHVVMETEKSHWRSHRRLKSWPAEVPV